MQMMIVKTLSVQSSVSHGDMGYIAFAQLSLRGTRSAVRAERTQRAKYSGPEVMILSCPDVDLICMSDLSSLTVCLNLLICKLAFI